MPAPSTIETHPQRTKIIEAIIAGQPYRDITAWTNPPVGRGVLSRFKRAGLKPWKESRRASREPVPIYDTEDTEVMTAPVQRAALVAHASPFRGQLEQLRSVTMRSIERAEQAVRIVKDREGNDVVAGADLACIAPLLAQGHRNVELLGKATGELDDRPATTNNLMISLNMPRGD